MNGKITITIEAKAVVPTLLVYQQYFNSKYPCTDETNDGSNMSLEDALKFETYNYLLAIYEKSKRVFEDEYKRMKEAVS